jgi:hypothetical protein
MFARSHHHHGTGTRYGLILRLVLLWLVIICTLVTIYLLLFTNMQQRSKNLKGIPDPIKVLLDQQISFHDLMKVDASTNDTLSIDDQIEGEERIIPMQVKHSDFAYVTLLHGIDQSFAYRGYLYNCIIMKEAL